MEMIQKENLCVDITGLCRVLSIGKTAAYDLVNSEAFYPAFKLKGKWLVNVDKLKRWLDEQSREGSDAQ